jgi:ABC-type nitrate/sulfonate/bicarbonate transport system substrate-binding protein
VKKRFNSREKKAGIAIILLVMAFCWLMAGCSKDEPASNSSAGADKNEEVYEIRIPDMYDATSLYIPYVAEEKGFFAEAGIKPVFTGVIGPGQHVAAVVAGTNDVGTMHVNRTINGIAAGAKIRAVVAGTETTESYPHMEYVVLEDSPLKEGKDIIGKKVGIVALGGCNEYTPYEYLKKYTDITDPKNQFEIVTVPAGNEETVLRTGQVDVIGIHGLVEEVFSPGGVRVLFDDYDVWEGVGGATPYYCRTDFIEQNPEAVRRFVSAIAKASNWANANRDEARKIQAERLKVDLDRVSSTYFAKDGIIKPETIQVWIDTLKGYGEVKADIPVENVYTNEFNEFAK